MKHDFWHQRWSEGRIGFHQADFNPYLKKYWQLLSLAADDRVFVPLCGKSKDMLWLREQGHEVLGVELNASACEAFFAENGAEPECNQKSGFVVRSVDGVELMCGDFFSLNTEDLRYVGAVYDRAALIALPQEMRTQYAEHLTQILPKGVQILLITLEYDGEGGPPFSVQGSEVERLFGAAFEIECLERSQPDDPRDVGRLEVTWMLKDKRA
ncbi:MAG: thiopurine S-methyltransferase [Neptuniibacter sp.]